MLPIEFVIASPYNFAVFLVVGMPHLGTKKRTAFGAYNARSKDAVSAIFATDALSSLYLGLHIIPLVRRDNNFVAVFNVVLGDFSFVDFFHFFAILSIFSQYICRFRGTRDKKFIKLFFVIKIHKSL